MGWDGMECSHPILWCVYVALGTDPMEEAALLVAKAQAEVDAMPEEEPRIRTRGRLKEGEEGKPRKLFSARARWGRIKCDSYFEGFLDQLRAEALAEAQAAQGESETAESPAPAAAIAETA